MLADAGSKGTVGPNLDDAFAGDRKQGFKESTIENVVLDQIREANLPMPKNLVKGQDAVDVAAYVASVAGTGKRDREAAVAARERRQDDLPGGVRELPHARGRRAHGTIGPNLDQLKPSETIVQHQVEVGGGVMPAFKGTLTAAQIAAVAKFVASSAGK